MKESEDLAVAHVAESMAEAEIVRTVLQGAGLYAIIPDANTPLQGIDLTPFDGKYESLGCQVVVRASDLEEAKRIIAEARSARLPDFDEDEDAEEGEAEEGDAEGGEAGEGDGG